MAGVMRIVSLASASALLLCLAATASPTAATASSPTPPDLFSFTDTDFTDGNVEFSSVFLASTVQGRSRTFSWTTSSRVDYVQLRNVVPDGSRTPYMQVLAMASSRGATASSTFGLSGPRYHGTKHARLRRALHDTQVILSDFESNPTDGSVTIPDMGVLADQGTLFFVALWEGGGHVFSRNFTVTTLRPGNAKLFELAAGYLSSAPHPEDQLSDGASLTSPVDPSTTAPSLTSPTAQTDLPEASVTPPAPAPAPAANVSSHEGGRLAPGTIIAIASGSAMAGLVVLTTLVWFILFRRGPERLSQEMGGNYGLGGMWTRQLAEKNASVETQHSAGSDDNLPGRAITTDNHDGVAVAPSNARPGSRGLQQPHTGDTPPPYLHPQSRDSPTIPRYLDLFNFSRATAQVGADASPTTSITPLAADAAPHATSDTATSNTANTAQGRGVHQGPYPHLVEDGMTDADILRLEEEERELDAAIETARRR